MAIKHDDTSNVISRQSKPARGFPWRLWLFAVVMTGAAAGGGYMTWKYREDATTARHARAGCATEVAKLQAQTAQLQTSLTDHQNAAGECKAELAAGGVKGKELETKVATLSTTLDASKEELQTLRAQRAEAEKRLAAMEDIQKQFAKMIDAGQLKVSARRGSLVLSLPSEVLFASGSADVSEAGQLAVLEIGITLKKLTDRRFLVVGHTDDVPLKSSKYSDNWELSTARALNVTRTLVKAGMNPKNLVPSGVGEHDPIARERAKNRRIEILLLPAIEELPPLPASMTKDDDKKK